MPIARSLFRIVNVLDRPGPSPIRPDKKSTLLLSTTSPLPKFFSWVQITDATYEKRAKNPFKCIKISMQGYVNS